MNLEVKQEPKQIIKSTFVLGGARSGKSLFAETLLEKWTEKCIYIATAEPKDKEMSLRIKEHQKRRPSSWSTIEAPLELVSVINKEANNKTAIIVDCLTIWLSNLIYMERDIEIESLSLVNLLGKKPCRIILVSNEVGLGIVPENALARSFRDKAGRLNQLMAKAADEVFFINAGLSICLKEMQ